MVTAGDDERQKASRARLRRMSVEENTDRCTRFTNFSAEFLMFESRRKKILRRVLTPPRRSLICAPFAG